MARVKLNLRNFDDYNQKYLENKKKIRKYYKFITSKKGKESLELFNYIKTRDMNKNEIYY